MYRRPSINSVLTMVKTTTSFSKIYWHPTFSISNNSKFMIISLVNYILMYNIAIFFPVFHFVLYQKLL